MKKQSSDPHLPAKGEKGKKGEGGEVGEGGSSPPLKRGKTILPLFKRRKSLDPGKLETPSPSSPSSSPFSFFSKKGSSRSSTSSSPKSGGSPRTPSPSNSKEQLPVSQETRAGSPSLKPARSSSSLHHVRSSSPPPLSHSGSSLNLSPFSPFSPSPPTSPKGAEELEGYGLLGEVFRRNGGVVVLLVEHCERNFCEEVVHCYQLILRFKNPAHVADDELPLRARDIYESFLMPGCSREVNVSHDSVAAALSLLRNPLYRSHLTSSAEAQLPLPRSTFEGVEKDLAPLLLHLLLDLRHSQPQRFLSLLRGDLRILPSS